MRRFCSLVLAIAIISIAPPGAKALDGTDEHPAPGPALDTRSALVQLTGEPLARAPKTRPPAGKKIEFSSKAVRSYRAQLASQHSEFKTWLSKNAPTAKVTADYDISLNAAAVQLGRETLAKLSRAPMVRNAEYQAFYEPTGHVDPDLALIQAEGAWTIGGGDAIAGEGVKIAIIDTGIDVSHPCFDDAGYPAQSQVGPTALTNNKVIVAKVFNNKTRQQGYTPEDARAHGTSVAAVAACNLHTPASMFGFVDIPYDVSGVAPRALLGNYNVFPGSAVQPRDQDILKGLEAAYTDGFDVANVSLSSTAMSGKDLLTVAVDNLDEANMVVTASAGNTGPAHDTVRSPASAARALTAGASSVGHFVGVPLTVNATTYAALPGAFGLIFSDLTAPLDVVTGPIGGLGTACDPLPADSLGGEIAVLSAGFCTPSTKIRNAQDAGAVAVVVVNIIAGDPLPMSSDGTPNQPTIPAGMVGVAARSALAASDGEVATVGAIPTYFSTGNSDIMGFFSSAGPTRVDRRVKPDVVAPGHFVLTAGRAGSCFAAPCFSFFSGTSFAAPHLAGSAAIVRQQYPNWSAAQVRSAIVNTADQGVLKNFATGLTENDVLVTGAGRENLLSAVQAEIALSPVSVSFGSVPVASGQSDTTTLTLTNLRSVAQNLVLSVGPASGTGVAYSVTPAVSLAPGESKTVNVGMNASPGASLGDHAATLSITDGGSELAHAVVYTFIR